MYDFHLYVHHDVIHICIHTCTCLNELHVIHTKIHIYIHTVHTYINVIQELKDLPIGLLDGKTISGSNAPPSGLVSAPSLLQYMYVCTNEWSVHSAVSKVFVLEIRS